MRYEFRVGYLDDGRLVVIVRNIDSCTTIGYLRSSLTLNRDRDNIITGQVNNAKKVDEGNYNEIYCLVKALNQKFTGKIYTEAEERDNEIINLAQGYGF